VGLQESIEYDPALSNAPPVYRYAPIEIFPVGGIIYITDEVFSTEPQVALKIVKLYFDKIAMLKQRKGPPCPGRQVEDASLLWRLCVRPELMQYLMDDCEQHEAELDAGDADAQRFVHNQCFWADAN
jgi:chromo domain-containing protein 1